VLDARAGLAVIGLLWASCAPHPSPPAAPAAVQRRYEVAFSIQGEPRRALVYAGAGTGRAPAVIYFHGRTGTAEDSERHMPFHRAWPEAYVVYAEGTNFDHRPEPANGWQIRFPQVAQYCKLDKDLTYVEKLLEHLRSTGRVDPERIFAAGHSSGAFFALSLMELLPERFRAFASVGSYARYRARLEPRICQDVYQGVGIGLREGADRAATPRPVLYVFGTTDTMFDGATPGYAADCARPSKARDSLLALLIRNGCELPKCEPARSFMADRGRQAYAPRDAIGAAVEFQLYDGGHGWPPETTGWVVDFFRRSL
jgi:poly(3-hydroxybutyrate) depolymerase